MNDTVLMPQISTGTVSNATFSHWKLGKACSGSLSFDSGNYLEVSVDGTIYKIALAS